jgi:large subunit ribosomal protein L10
MKREQKATAVEEIATQIGDAEAIFAIDYRGISVPQAAELRAKLREADASFRVVKNRLTKLAADKAGQDELKPLLEGPTALTFVRGDTATAAKAISTFNREHQVLTFKGGFMEGLVLDEEKFTSIARLPSREVLNGQFAGVVASPLTGLVRGLAAMVSGLAIQLQQIAEQGLIGEQPVPVGESAERTPTEQPPAEQDEPPAEQEQPPVEKGAPEETSEESETEEE